MSGLGAAEPRARSRRRACLLVVLLAIGLLVLRVDLAAVVSAAELAAALARLKVFLDAFVRPDLSSATLWTCVTLAVETAAVALLACAAGLVLAVPLALWSSRAVARGDLADDAPTPWPRRLALEGTRLLRDLLRGVPDFVWALLFANLLGVGPITGLVAIAVNVAGIFGKVLAEQWDAIAPQRTTAVRAAGGGRFTVFVYGVLPLAARANAAFVLMRVECAVRNASVIGVVGGGGLGAALWDAYIDGAWSRVATVLLALLAATASVDVLANLVRRRLRTDPNHPRARRAIGRRTAAWRRAQVGVALLALLGGCAWWLWQPLRDALRELMRVDAGFAAGYALDVFAPATSPGVWLAVLRESLVPLAIALWASTLGALLAGVLVMPASWTFQFDAASVTGERAGVALRTWRGLRFVAARTIALVLRGVPEAAWLVLLMVWLRAGTAPCVLALALHSAGVLHRVFTEAVDDVPFVRLRAVGAGRMQAFAYAALPAAWPHWRSYLSFQFEVTMRAGIALGLVGAGGLGQLFRNNLAFRQHADAAAFLWGMVLLTVAVDRLGRRPPRRS